MSLPALEQDILAQVAGAADEGALEAVRADHEQRAARIHADRAVFVRKVARADRVGRGDEPGRCAAAGRLKRANQAL